MTLHINIWLEKTYFGCGVGVHTGWGAIEVKDEPAALVLLPSFLRGKARVIKVDRFTPEQIESFHKM